MKRIGLGFLGEPGAGEIVRIAKKAEERGFDSVWMCETRFTRDAISPLAGIATSTRKVILGSSAINAFTRGPVLIAVTLATLDELSKGRMILGIGPGSPAILERQGIEFQGALQRLREYVEVFRLLMRGKTVDYSGRFVRVKGAALDFTPVREEIPVYLAVTGPQALRLAGKIADGVLLNAFTSVSYVKRAINLVREGAKSAGRRLGDLDITSLCILSVDENSKRAKDRLRWFVATYLVTFPAIARESGISEDLLTSIRTIYQTKGLEYASKQVPDSVIDALTASGNPDECVQRIREYVAAGVKSPIVMPVASDPDLVIKTGLSA